MHLAKLIPILVQSDLLEHQLYWYKLHILGEMQSIGSPKPAGLVTSMLCMIASYQWEIRPALKKLLGDVWYPPRLLPENENQFTSSGEQPCREKKSEEFSLSENRDEPDNAAEGEDVWGDYDNDFLIRSNLDKFNDQELNRELLQPLIHFFCAIHSHFSGDQWEVLAGGRNSGELEKLLKQLKTECSSYLKWRRQTTGHSKDSIKKSLTTFRYTSDEFKPRGFAHCELLPLSFALLHALYTEFEKADTELQCSSGKSRSKLKIKEKICARLHALNKQDLKMAVKEMVNAKKIAFSQVKQNKSTSVKKNPEKNDQIILFNDSTWFSAFEEAGLKDLIKADSWAFQRKKKAAKAK